jgi:hypothetical protein
VLTQYIKQGVRELDQDKLGDLLQLKYHTIDDAADKLGGVPVIRDTFVDFQQVSLSVSGPNSFGVLPLCFPADS